MADYLIIDGDQAIFMPGFSGAMVVVLPGIITGTGKSVAGKKICVEGDEASVEVDCAYTMPPFIAPGKGTIIIAKLAANQLSTTTTDSGKKIILKGNRFVARFIVKTKATDPTTGLQDPAPSHIGLGNFISTNLKVTVQ